MNKKLTNLPVIRWFLPVAHRGTQGARARRISLYVIFTLVIFCAALPFTYILPYQLHLPLAGMTVLGGILMVLFGLILVRVTDNLSMAAHWSSFTVYVAVSGVAILTGGVKAPALWWLILCPMYALFFSGIRGGFFWSSLVMLTAIGFYVGADQVASFSTYLRGADQQWLLISTFLGLNVCVIGYVAAYRYFITDFQLKQLKKGQREEREARREAEEANRAKTEFLANTSHEIRTPINTITGMVELLNSTELSEQQTEYLSEIEDSAYHLLETINGILEISRLRSGSREVQQGPVCIRRITVEVLESLAPNATKKGIGLQLFVSDEVPLNLQGDEDLIRQVLHNLVFNAIRYTSSGHVCVRVDLEQQNPLSSRLRFQVQDTGVGISEDEQEQIFDPFQRSSHPLMDEVRGPGIGLTLSDHLVELLGGTIEVNSEPGEGSTFFFTAEFQHDGTEPEYPVYQTDDLQGTRVLIYNKSGVDADPIVSHLEKWGLPSNVVQERADVVAELEDYEETTNPYDLLLFMGMGHQSVKMHLPEQFHEQTVQTLPVMALIQPGPEANSSDEDVIDVYMSYPVHPEALLKQIHKLVAGPPDSILSETTDGWTEQEKRPIRRVLFAEDNGPVRAVVTKQLQEQGYEVTPVSNGQEAVDQFQDRRFDVVLMDVQMPKLDGYDAARQIREMQGETRDLPIIALTAQALETDRVRCFEAGFTGYLTKPADGDTLRETIEGLLSDDADSIS